MIDELDLAFDEQAEKGRPRHRRGARGSKGGGKGGKSVIAFLMVFILLGVLGVGTAVDLAMGATIHGRHAR
jgi:UPF0755 protein